MKVVSGKSESGRLEEALRGISNPDLIILITTRDHFEDHVGELQKRFPDVPSIGTTGIYYDSSVKEGTVGVVAMSGVKAATGVMRSASTMPIRDIEAFEKTLREVGASSKDTVCIDLCAGNDACVLTTMYSVLDKQGISLTGGTSLDGIVSVNGEIYEDADAYAFVKNLGGRIKTYKENIYRPADDKTYIASKVDRSNYYVGELNGKSSKQVYMDLLGIPESQIATQTFKNPFGKIAGDDICIISLKEVKGNGLCCYRQVNDSDVLTLLQIQDYRAIVDETIQKIEDDFGRPSGVFAVNCMFRYLLFQDEHYLSDYLRSMSSVGSFCGFFANGEHYNSQFVNQSMSCVVFE